MNTLFNDVFMAVQPVLLQAISAMLMAFLVWVANTARIRYGIEIEKGLREGLHSAAMSGVRAALSRGLSGTELNDAVIDHVIKSTPDAIARLNPARDVLETIIEGKLKEVVDGVPIYSVDVAGLRATPTVRR